MRDGTGVGVKPQQLVHIVGFANACYLVAAAADLHHDAERPMHVGDVTGAILSCSRQLLRSFLLERHST